MPLRRPLALRLTGASAAVAMGLFTSAALAQPAPAAPPAPPPAAETPVRFAVGLHAGLLYRVGEVDEVNPIARGGGLAGANLWLAPIKWFAVGAGYERAFFGRERADVNVGSRTEISRTFDTLWINGRVYPWQNDDIALFFELAGGPVWQAATRSSTTPVEDPSGQVTVSSFTCSGRGSAAFGVRGGIGAEMHFGSVVAFEPRIGVDHLQLSDDLMDGCARGAGASTFLAARIGFVFSTGRVKAPPPPPDKDNDGITDAEDACPDVPGVKDADPKKNGCPPDKDADGIVDAQDACPDVPGVPDPDPKKNGCPSDKDSDGIIDVQDACPEVAGVPDEDPKQHGCPPKDTDGDGIIDKQDACVDIKGVKTEDPATNGCPPDTDGDAIRDDKDACPEVKGVPNEDPSKNGCPRVVFTAKEVVINQQIQFDVDKATIKPESNELLDEIAGVIKSHGELKKIEVQGHTDNTANKQHNKILSAQRAEAVRKALVKRGVADKALVAKGYGQEQPIADNATEPGRAKNRRVQFVILEKLPVGEDGKPTQPQPGGANTPAPGGANAAPAAPAKKPAAAAPAAPAKKPAAPAAPAKKPAPTKK